MISQIGKLLIFSGIVLMVVGIFLYFAEKFPDLRIPYLGKLPGDIRIRKKNFVFYFPITTCILISIFLTILLRLFLRR